MSDANIFSPMKHLLEDERLDEANKSIPMEDLKEMIWLLDEYESKMHGDDKRRVRRLMSKYWQALE